MSAQVPRTSHLGLLLGGCATPHFGVSGANRFRPVEERRFLLRSADRSRTRGTSRAARVRPVLPCSRTGAVVRTLVGRSTPPPSLQTTYWPPLTRGSTRKGHHRCPSALTPMSGLCREFSLAPAATSRSSSATTSRPAS